MLRRPPPAKKAAVYYQPIPSDPPEPPINSNPDEWRITMVSEIKSIFLMNSLLTPPHHSLCHVWVDVDVPSNNKPIVCVCIELYTPSNNPCV